MSQPSAGRTGAEQRGFTPTDLAPVLLLCAQYQEVSAGTGVVGVNEWVDARALRSGFQVEVRVEFHRKGRAAARMCVCDGRRGVW